MGDQSESSAIPNELTTLGNYAWPTIPTNDRAGEWYEKVRQLLAGDAESAPQELVPDRLNRAADYRLIDTVHGVLERHYDRILDSTYEPWLTRQSSAGGCSAIVRQPTLPSELFIHWAESHQLDCVAASDAKAVLAEQAPDTDNILCIHSLPSIYWRGLGGLEALRELLEALTASRRRVILDIGSWPWRFLDSVLSISVVFRHRYVFPAYDARALQAVLREVAVGMDVHRPVYSSDGDVVLSDDMLAEDGETEDDTAFLRVLAERHFGCPWGALAQFERSASEEALEPGKDASREEVDQSAVAAEEIDSDPEASAPRPVWVSQQPSLRLPSAIRRESALVLHALLIHDALSLVALRRVLPFRVEHTLLNTLVSEGFVETTDDLYRVSAEHYRSTRNELFAIGIPVDEL